MSSVVVVVASLYMSNRLVRRDAELPLLLDRYTGFRPDDGAPWTQEEKGEVERERGRTKGH